MECWFNFEKQELVMEPESTFEMSFLSDLLGQGDALTTTTLVSELDNSVVGLCVKSLKTMANSSAIKEEEIDEMYEEMENEEG